ncbi:MAG: glycosyltransferase family 39 protein [Myxococcales bacterium]|nr:glycosyltransferase family 39 protein [Myxococcales bacterium]
MAILAGFLLLRDLASLGIWDPHELGLADHGCRRAAASGKVSLAACGIEAGSKATDVRPIVMVQTVAFGFKTFGVSEWAARLPLALWLVVGALAITLAVSRLVDARAGLFSGAVFVTMPTILVQGRLILGDAATMGAFALALSGLAVAAFDTDDDGAPSPLGARVPWLLVGAAGVVAGVGCRGVAVGTAPALAIGIAWLVRTANDDDTPRLQVLLGVATLAVAAFVGIKMADGELKELVLRPASTRAMIGCAIAGALALAAGGKGTVAERVERGVVGAVLGAGAFGVAEGVAVGLLAEDGKFIGAAGATANGSRKFPTYDLYVRQIAHGAFPWSCFLPFAIGRALARPAAVEGTALRRETDLRVAALVAAACCFGVQAILAPRFGLIPFAAPVALAIVVGVVLRDLERAPTASLAVAIGTAVLAFLVLNDFSFEDLSKAPVELATAPIIEPYGLYGVMAPEELRTKLTKVLAVAAAVFLLPIFFVWVDENPEPGWTKREALERPIRGLVAAWKHPYYGLLLLLALSFEACFLLAGFVTWKRKLRHYVPQLQALSGPQRDIVVNLWWYTVVGAIGAYFAYVGFLYGRDLFRALRRQRVATIAVGGLVAGGIWSLGVMPAVANQFSPKGVFASYRKLGAGAPIGLLGVNARTAAYDLKANPIVFNDAKSTHDWLVGGGRRFVALRSEHLAELNNLFRQKSEPRVNLPIVDGRSAQILLATNALEGHKNENPLDRMVLAGIPTATTNCNEQICVPSRALADCDLDGKLACVGWELADGNGQPVGSVTSGQRVRLRMIYRVTARISGGWQIFIHVEQPGTATARKTWDHVPLGGKYPMDNWLPGDVIVDDSEFNLEPNMPAGRAITILTGFFSGSTRLPLIKGPNAGPEAEGMRLVLGSVPVR